MKTVLLFLFFSAGFFIQAQDVSGIWRGSFYGQQSKIMKMLGEEGDRYKFELQIDQTAKAFQGVTYSYKTTVFYGKATCQGTVNTKNQNVLLEELKLVELKMMQGSAACVMTCRMHYTRLGDEEFLEGTYTSYNATDSTNCGGGTIRLRKVVTSDFYKEPFIVAKEKKAGKGPLKKSTPALAANPPVKKAVTPGATTNPTTSPAVKKPSTAANNPATKAPGSSAAKPGTGTAKKPTARPATGAIAKKDPEKPREKLEIAGKVQGEDMAPPDVKKPVKLPKVLSSRENELVKTIYVPTGKISINIYDNGSVDNDTISVYLDKKLVLSKKRLTEQAIVLDFDVDSENDEHELIMVAENLGEIPPNTSLMVVSAGDKKYEVRITSTEQKNAVIVFKLQKK